MIRPKSTMRRVLAVTAGAALATVGALAFASPASAHSGSVTGDYTCVDGKWVVTWTVTNDMPNKKAKLTSVKLTPQGTTVTNIRVNAEVPVANWKGNKLELGRLVGEQQVPASAKEAKLTVKLSWPGYNPKGELSHTIKFKGHCKPTPPPTTPPATPPATTPPATPPATTPPVDPEPTTPAPTTPAPTTPPATPTPDPTGEPTGSDESTCDELIIKLSNPEDGIEFTLLFTPNKGEPQSVTVKPGDKDVTIKFPGSEGLEVIPSFGELEGEPIVWEKPGNCEPAGGGGGEGDLPLTGAAAGGIAAGAVLLLGAGVVLYIVARRRRVTFTA